MKNEFLRHTLATIKYRFEKSVAGSREGFGQFSLGQGSRSPIEIVNHINHLLYSTRLYLGEDRYISEQPEKLTLTQEIERFQEEILTIDQALSSKELLLDFTKRLLQGPFSDILTHVGQISMLQRIHGNPNQAEDFSVASIKTGLNS